MVDITKNYSCCVRGLGQMRNLTYAFTIGLFRVRGQGADVNHIPVVT